MKTNQRVPPAPARAFASTSAFFIFSRVAWASRKSVTFATGTRRVRVSQRYQSWALSVAPGMPGTAMERSTATTTAASASPPPCTGARVERSGQRGAANAGQATSRAASRDSIEVDRTETNGENPLSSGLDAGGRHEFTGPR